METVLTDYVLDPDKAVDLLWQKLQNDSTAEALGFQDVSAVELTGVIEDLRAL